MFAPKAVGELQFCGDLSRFDEATKRNSYPVSRMDECTDFSGDATLFTTLDCNSIYWQVQISEAERDMTTFATLNGAYRFTRVLLELRNATALFQKAFDVIVNSESSGSMPCCVYMMLSAFRTPYSNFSSTYGKF